MYVYTCPLLIYLYSGKFISLNGRLESLLEKRNLASKVPLLPGRVLTFSYTQPDASRAVIQMKKGGGGDSTQDPRGLHRAFAPLASSCVKR